ncbi:uncharacterized protein LAJ45_10418 [Morchella importuna]|uniref:uncharacterized protein n=1 Tax=Morchella importuna TaxID=1174673 RepID=UPI001E8CBD16|nr:uncharacterized protein LAJ45_10418 [Morchella importuna]KAH8145617.1 hypothetical protein LAJ45_10418 [Morchella importuna]
MVAAGNLTFKTWARSLHHLSSRGSAIPSRFISPLLVRPISLLDWVSLARFSEASHKHRCTKRSLYINSSHLTVRTTSRTVCIFTADVNWCRGRSVLELSISLINPSITRGRSARYSSQYISLNTGGKPRYMSFYIHVTTGRNVEFALIKTESIKGI